MRLNNYITSITAFFLCGCVLLLSSCSPKNNNSSDNNGTVSTTTSTTANNEAISFLDGNPLKLVKKSEIPAGDSKGSLGIISAFDGRYLLIDYLNGMEQFYEYTAVNKKMVYVGQRKLGFMSSGDFIITNNNEYWCSQADSEGDELWLYKVGIKEKSVDVMLREKITPPFRYYHKINENSLIFFGPNELYDSNGEVYYSYTIDVYDIEKNKKRNIVQIADPNKKVSMPSVYYNDNLIYTLQCESRSGDTSHLTGRYVIPDTYTSHYIRAYDTDGNLKVGILLPDMTEFESIYNVFAEMFVFDNIVFLSTLNRLMVAFEMLPDGTVKQLELPLNQPTQFFTLKGGGAEKAYLYSPLRDSLIIYDRKSRCFTEHTIDINPEINYSPFLSENGDLLFGLQEKKQEPLDIYELR